MWDIVSNLLAIVVYVGAIVLITWFINSLILYSLMRRKRIANESALEVIYILKQESEISIDMKYGTLSAGHVLSLIDPVIEKAENRGRR